MIEAKSWTGAAPKFDGPTAEAEADSEAARKAAEWDAEIAARVERMGPEGAFIAKMLTAMTLDGDRVACEKMGAPWPFLSGESNAANLEKCRGVLEHAWTETLAMIWPRFNSKFSAPTIAVGATVGGKVMLVVAAKRSGRGRVVDAKATEAPPRSAAGGGMPWG